MSPHELKTWPKYFQAVIDNQKLFELRLNDRNYQVGDVLTLREWDPEVQSYTGRIAHRRVTFLVEGEFGLKEGYVAMSMSRL